jgi:serine/threonine protein kinase
MHEYRREYGPCAYVRRRNSRKRDGVQVLCHVAQRLHVLHAAGWAHRDIKPGNVLRRPEHHSWTLIDFGCTARTGACAQHPFDASICVASRLHSVSASSQSIEPSELSMQSCLVCG